MHIECKDNYGQTPLLCAVKASDVNMASKLLGWKANPDCKDGHGWRPLFYAIESFKGVKEAEEVKEVVMKSLEAGANLELKDEFGQTPLSLAAHGGLTDMVGMLLNDGAKPNSKNDSGLTPLSVATRGGMKRW